MGYSHFWYRLAEMDQGKFSAVASDFNNILPVFKEKNIGLTDGPGEGKPIVAADQIQFNGEGVMSNEWFDITKTFSGRDLRPDDPMKFGSCKTASKPYDLAVMCCLLIFKHHFGDDIRVQSNGGAKEWAPAIDLVRHELKHAEDWGFMKNKDGEPHLVDTKSAA